MSDVRTLEPTSVTWPGSPSRNGDSRLGRRRAAETGVRWPSVRVVAVAAVLVVVAGVAAVVLATGGDEIPRAGARAVVSGRATLVRVDGSTTELASGDIVRAGEEVRVGEGTVVLELAGGGTVEGRAGFAGAASTRVVVGERPEVLAGEALVGGEDGLTVLAGGTAVTVEGDDGAGRVASGLSVRAASYRSALQVDSAGQERTVPALRQLGIASLGRPPARPVPLRVDERDPWDRRFLGAAIELTAQLDAVSRTFTANTPQGAAASAPLLETLLPGLDGGASLPRLLADGGRRPAGEVLVGAAIASLADGGTLAERWEAVFDFRAAGASWGLVALDREVPGDELLGVLAAALDRALSPAVTALAAAAAVEPAEPAPAVGQDAGATPDAGGSSPAAPDGGGSGRPDGGGRPSTPTDDAPPPGRGRPDVPPPATGPPPGVPAPGGPPVPPPAARGPVGDVADSVGDLAGGTLGGVGDAVGGTLGGVGDAVGGTLGGVGDAVDGTLSGVGDAVGGTLGGVGDAVDGTLDGVGGVLDGLVPSIPGLGGPARPEAASPPG